MSHDLENSIDFQNIIFDLHHQKGNVAYNHTWVKIIFHELKRIKSTIFFFPVLSLFSSFNLTLELIWSIYLLSNLGQPNDKVNQFCDIILQLQWQEKRDSTLEEH